MISSEILSLAQLSNFQFLIKAQCPPCSCISILNEGDKNKLFNCLAGIIGSSNEVMMVVGIASGGDQQVQRRQQGGVDTIGGAGVDAVEAQVRRAARGPQTTSGSASTGPLTGNTTFSLSCQGSGGSVTASATVTVGAAPLPAVSGSRSGWSLPMMST